jgi:hypothetical protein
VFDAVELEKLGKPTITMGHETFAKAAHLHAEALGLADLKLIFEPPPAGGNVPEEVLLTDEQLKGVLRALTDQGTSEGSQ